MLYKHLAWPSLFVIRSLGCAPGGSDGAASAGAPDRPTSGRTDQIDLGTILSYGQTIEREFLIKNPTSRVWKIAGAQAAMPCCSEVVTFPHSVAAHGSGSLKVRFRPGYGSGGKTLDFQVLTDQPENPVITYRMTCRMVAEVVIVPVVQEELRLLAGTGGATEFRVISRRAPGSPAAVLENVRSPKPSKITFVGNPHETVREDGFVESERRVRVEVAPESSPGRRSDTFLLMGSDGRSREHILHWTVLPHLNATPDAFVVKADESVTKSLLIRSETTPFRVLDVRGARLEGEGSTMTVPAKTHVVRFRLEPDSRREGNLFDVTIRTDHPDQPEVIVSVLVTASAREALR